jgi:hypothetical protein
MSVDDTHICERCHIGIDDDFDGDCAICASAGNKLIAALNALRERAKQAERRLHEHIISSTSKGQTTP